MLQDLMVKAERTDGRGWVTGFVAYPHDVKNDLYCFHFVDKLDFWGDCIIDANTLCRSTGEKDNAGNVIYENDIIYEADGADDGYFYVVRWDDTELAFIFDCHELYRDNLREICSTPWRDTTIIGAYTVIGNTIDNPEFEMNGTLSEEELRKIRLTQLIEEFSDKVSVSLKKEQATFAHNGEEHTINLIPEEDEAIRVEYQVAKYILENVEKEMMQDPWGDIKSVEVVGNLFDTPEFLQDKEADHGRE